MEGVLGVLTRPDGQKEVHARFASWPLPDGSVVEHVSIHPHPCGTCIGGDHTHVEQGDVREPFEPIRPFVLPEAFVQTITQLLVEKKRVNELTQELHAHLHS